MIKKPTNLRQDMLVAAALLTGMSAMASPSLARADEAADKDTIVVTGQRRGDNPYGDPKAPYRVVKSANTLFTETLNDTPKSVQILPEALLEDMAVNTMRDLFRSQPGITLATGEGGNAFGDRIFIRGFDARNDIYIDGVRDPGLGSREVFATQQIEIIKGPSSTHGGRGTTGGALSMVSKQPKSFDTTSVELTLGTDNTQRLTIDTNKVISKDLAIRFNLMGHTGDTPGRDHVFNNRWGAAFAIEYQPIEPLNLGLDYYHLSTDYMPDWGQPWDMLINAPTTVGRNRFYGIKDRDFGLTLTDVFTIQADYIINQDIKLRSVLRYGATNNEYRATAPEGITTDPLSGRRVVGANVKPRFQQTDYITNLTNLTWDFRSGAIEHSLVTGFELSKEDTRMRTYSFVECEQLPCSGTAPRIFQDLIAPDFNYPWNVTSETATGHTKINTQTKAIYAIDTMHFGDQWIATLGVRADNYKTEHTSLNYQTLAAGVPVNTDSDFYSYHAGIVHKPNQWSSLYLSYSSSSNPPCEQLDSTAVDYGGCDALTFSLQPIKNRSFELGGKFALNPHLDVTGAFYDIKRSGVPSVIRTGSVSTLYLEGQTVKGFELMATGNITAKWSISAGLTAFTSKTDDSTNPLSQNLNKPFPNVSETSLSVTQKYKINEQWAIGGTWIHQSEKFGGTFSAGSNKLPAFDRFDLMAEYTIRKGLELQFNVLNATDKVYYDALYRSVAPYVYIAPGRSFSVMLDWHF